MSHRIIRSIAGSSFIRISAITGLALGLACGGGNQVVQTPENPQPSTPVVNGLDGPVINGHTYKVTAAAKDAVSWYVEGPNLGNVTDLVSTGKGEWNYTPRLAGNSRADVTFKFYAVGIDQVKSDPILKTVPVTPNNAPILPDRLKGELPVIYVSRGSNGAAYVQGLPTTDADGDTIKWLQFPSIFSEGSFISAGGVVTIGKNAPADRMVFDASGVSVNKEYEVTIYYTEYDKDGVVPVKLYNEAGQVRKPVRVVVGSISDGADVAGGMRPTNTPSPSFTVVPNQSNEFIVGIPKVFKFEAVDNANPGFQAATWSLTNPASDKWIATSGEVEIPAGFGGEAMRLSLANDRHPDYQTFRSMRPGYGVFIPQSASSARLDVTAVFAGPNGTTSTAPATGNVTIRQNNAPILTPSSDAPEIYTVVDTSGIVGNWPSQSRQFTDNALVFRGTLPITSEISFKRTFRDFEMSSGDIVTLELEGVYVGDRRSDVENWNATDMNNFYRVNNPSTDIGLVPQTPRQLTSDSPLVTINGTIVLNMPTNDNFTYGNPSYNYKYDDSREGLSFIYKLTDLGGNTTRFAIHVPTKKNSAPIFDNYDGSGDSFPFHSGDDPGWGGPRPSVGSKTGWTINWSTDHITGSDYKIADPDEDDIFMAPASNSYGFSTSGQYREPGNKFEFSWTPLAGMEGKSYSITMNAWDKYGYAAYPLKLKGVVNRSITGKPVTKQIYAGYDPGNPTATPPVPAKKLSTDKRPADFSAWASIYLNSFYAYDPNNPNSVDKEKINAYMSDLGEEGGRHKWLPEFGTDTSTWKMVNVPPGPYLVSADRRKGNAFDLDNTPPSYITKPVVGPAVTSTNMKEVGGDWFDEDNTDPELFRGGNRYVYAYIESSTPDLTTYAGSGRLSGMVDGSLDDPTCYNFAKSSSILVGTDETAVYKGLMGKIGSLAAGDAIQFAFPSMAQSGFFGVDTSNLEHIFPSNQYKDTRGFTGNSPWFTGNLGDAGSPTTSSDLTRELSLNTSAPDTDIIKYATTTDDRIQLSAMRETDASSSAGLLVGFPYWRMVSTGTATPNNEKAIGVGGKVEQVTNFAPTENSNVSFNARINRSSFRQFLGQQVTWNPLYLDTPSGLYSKVDDTLQVKAYVNGISLGPDNHAGLPTLLEFGNFNAPATVTKFGSLTNFNGEANLGSIPIPKPNKAVWNGDLDSNGNPYPVASYIATFPSPTGLPGSMGLITDNMTGAISRQVRPAINVKITGVADYSATRDLSRGKAPNHASAGILVSNYVDGTLKNPKNISPPSNTGPSNVCNADVGDGIKAVAYTENSPTIGEENGNAKIWLSWTNEGNENISGNIIEFFREALPLSADSVPKYVVYVSPKYTEFPIPNTWVTALAGGTAHPVIVRIRTVRYGNAPSNANSSTPSTANWINFNDSPFKKLLPYAWAETITEKIDFTNAIDFKGWVDGQTVTATGFPISINSTGIGDGSASFDSGLVWNFGSYTGEADDPGLTYHVEATGPTNIVVAPGTPITGAITKDQLNIPGVLSYASDGRVTLNIPSDQWADLIGSGGTVGTDIATITIPISIRVSYKGRNAATPVPAGNIVITHTY